MKKEAEANRMHAGASPIIFQLAAKLRNNLTEVMIKFEAVKQNIFEVLREESL